MRLLRAIVSLILIFIIGFSDIAISFVYASETTQKPNPVNKENVVDPVEEIPQGVMKVRKTNSSPAIVSLADMTTANISAARRVPISVQKLKKTLFTPEEDVEIVINNPDNEPFTTKIIDPEGKDAAAIIDEVDTGLTTELHINATNQFKPGKYTLSITDTNGKTTKQDFTWGVLALNPDKAMYKPGEEALFSMAVLDEHGEMVCNASVALTIRNEQLGINERLSTGNGRIVANDVCNKKEFTLTPDYEAKFKLGGVGTYELELSAITRNGTFTIKDTISVAQQTPFEVTRSSATRLYPPLTYPMNIEVTASEDFQGTITETVPDSFTITPADEHASYDGLKTVYLDGQDPASSLEGKILGASTSLQMPFDGTYTITQGFGGLMTDESLRAFYGKYGLAGHDGLDIALPMGTPLYAVDDGNIIWSGPGDYGITIIIQHTWGRSYYGHLSKTSIGVNTHVTKGSLIGYSGNTGESTGPHLHFGMKPENPDMDNGYAGKIDPLPYLTELNNASAPHAFTEAINSSGVLSASTSAHEEPAPTPIDPVASPSALPTSLPNAQKVSSASAAPTVPFSVISQEIQSGAADDTKTFTEKVKVLKWQVSMKKGEKKTFSYSYKAPLISPQFYLMGSAKLFDSQSTLVYDEGRKWQLAADAVGVGWYNYSWQYRKPITIDRTKVVNNSATSIPFMEGGTDATQDLGLYASSFQDVTSSTARPHTGPRSLQFNSGATGTVATLDTESGTLGDSGRISMWINFDQVSFTDLLDIIQLYNGSTFVDSVLGMNTSNKLTLNGTAGATTIAPDTWYHVVVAYRVTSSTVNEYRLYLNGTLDASVSNVTTNTGTNQMRFGLVDDGTNTLANRLLYIDDIYFDNASDLSYPGDIRVTHKRPNANGASNGFTTQIGSGGSGYGSGHAPQVNEQPRSSTNGWRTTSANISENYNIESASTGDVDISSFNQVGYTGWIYANRAAGTCTTPKITLNGVNTDITLNTGNTPYMQGVPSKTYPSSSAKIGIVSCAGALQVNIYEAGVHFAYTTSDNPLTNFPVLVSLTSDTNLSSKAQGSGNDILFTASDGKTKLPHEIESYASGTLVAWVKVPSLSLINNTDIYMYYGNASAANQQDSTNVWSGNYTTVHHMEEVIGTSYNMLDSTSTGNHHRAGGAVAGNAPTRVTGKLGFGQDFDGTSDRTDGLVNGIISGIAAYTIELWINIDGCSGNYEVIFKQFGTNSIELSTCYNNNYDFALWLSSGNEAVSVGTLYSPSTWTHIAVVNNGSGKVDMFVNGVAVSMTDSTVTPVASAGVNVLSTTSQGTPADWFGGLMDELRTSTTARTGGWFTTQYNNQNSPSTFYSVGEEETKAYAATNEQQMRHGKFFDSTGSEQPFIY